MNDVRPHSTVLSSFIQGDSLLTPITTSPTDHWSSKLWQNLFLFVQYLFSYLLCAYPKVSVLPKMALNCMVHFMIGIVA